jgi:hypothetical protein
MTPSDKLAYLESLATRKPQARLSAVLDKLRVHEKAEEMKRAMEPKGRQQIIIDELRALGRKMVGA